MFESERIAGMNKIGEEVVLSIPQESDLPTIVEYLNDGEVMVELNPEWEPTTLENEIEQLRSAENDLSTVLWYIRIKDSCIGAAWINKIDIEKKSGSFGIMIGDKNRWGQGIAITVANAISEYAFGKGDLNLVHVSLTEKNEGSRIVALKAGYTLHKGQARFVGEATYEGWEGELTKENWTRNQHKND